MSDKVRQVLPVGRFVAVALIAINEANRSIEIWNGGMPAPAVARRGGAGHRCLPFLQSAAWGDAERRNGVHAGAPLF